jgi:two-component system sensor histidine kinase/response regulator
MLDNNTYQADILIVDDTPANLRILTSMLQSYGYRVRPAINGQVALTAVQNAAPDLILLDIMMPGMTGYEVCERLKSNDQTKDIPVIFVSALDDTLDKVKAFEVGAIDYIAKPFQLEEVVARIENHLTMYQQRREIARLNEFKDLLLRTVSHDLKNPITNIIGYTELLLEQSAQGPEMITTPQSKTILTRIFQTATHMQQLVTRLLDLSALEGGADLQITLVSLNETLTRQFIDFELSIQQKALKLEIDLPESGTIIEGDVHWLDEVFGNLLGNAVKYTPPQGQIRITLIPRDEDIQITISDNGIGIPAEALPHIFERFYRVEAHREYSGSGLGLSIVQAIVQRHNGQITVESEPNEGTTFVVTLPRKQGKV